ncbi:Protein of unknown function [Cotesia congregata]|uniref:Uncharacterized protein n=1 Tax=Cotesia congregata TaxID=51543 RepID=A0A8J2HAH1_COTCN|nr:Protein of unknown function [Cotesia congregata]
MANAASTKARANGLAHIKAKTDTGNIDLNLRNTLLVKDLRTNLISVSKITMNDREILFRKDDAIVRDLNGEEEDPEPGRVLRDRRSCREIVREPSPARARGRPKKQKSGKPGRPRKLYRYVSASSITSSRASSRENLSQEEEEAPKEDDEEASNDVFIPSAVDEKSPKKDEDNTDEGEEFMDAKFIEELALLADVELEEAIRGTESTEWKRALAAEARSHLEHGTWDLVECPENGIGYYRKF